MVARRRTSYVIMPPSPVRRASRAAPRRNYQLAKAKEAAVAARAGARKAVAAAKERLAGKGAVIETVALFTLGTALSATVEGLGWASVMGIDARLIVGGAGIALALFGKLSPEWTRRLAALSAGIMAPALADSLSSIISTVTS